MHTGLWNSWYQAIVIKIKYFKWSQFAWGVIVIKLLYALLKWQIISDALPFIWRPKQTT